jgi:hypothetical protein
MVSFLRVRFRSTRVVFDGLENRHELRGPVRRCISLINDSLDEAHHGRGPELPALDQSGEVL